MKFSKNPLELNVTEYISHNTKNSNINLLNNSNIILTTKKNLMNYQEIGKKYQILFLILV